MSTSVLRTLAVRLTMNTATFHKRANKVMGSLDRMQKRARRAQAAAGNFSGIISGVALTQLGRDFVNLADSMQLLENKMGAAVPTAQGLKNAMHEVARISRESRMEIDAVGTLYQRLTVATQQLGSSQEDVARLTQVVANSFLLSGATGSEAANSARQLAQGLASGALRGDEFRSVSENNVVLTQMLAKGLGKTVGQLREYAYEGKLTADMVMRIAGSEEQLAETTGKVTKMQRTWSQSLTLFRTEMSLMASRIDKEFGVLTRLGNALMWVGDNIAVIGLTAAAVAVPALVAFAVSGLGSLVTYAGAAILSLGLFLTRMAMVAGAAIFATAKFVAFPVAAFGALAAILDYTGIWKSDMGAEFTDLFDKIGGYLGKKIYIWVNQFKLLSEKIKLGILYAIPGVQEGEAAARTAIAGYEGLIAFAEGQLASSFDALKGKSEEAGNSILKVMNDALEPIMGESWITQMVEAFKSLPQTILESLPLVKKFMDATKGGAAPTGNDQTLPLPPEFLTESGMIARRILKAGGRGHQDFSGSPLHGTDGLGALLGSNIDSFKENFGKPVQDAIDSITSAFANMGDKISTVFTDAITGVTSLKDGLMAIGNTIANTVIKSFIRMGVEWIAQKVAMWAADRALMPARVAAAAGEGAAMAAAFAPAAAMASLASFGANAAPAMAGIGTTTAFAKAAALTGMAHDGIDNVPNEGTWLLDKGERVLSPKQNADLTNFLSESGSGNNQPITIAVNGVSDPDVVMEAIASRRGEMETMLRRITSDNLGRQV